MEIKCKNCGKVVEENNVKKVEYSVYKNAIYCRECFKKLFISTQKQGRDLINGGGNLI